MYVYHYYFSLFILPLFLKGKLSFMRHILQMWSILNLLFFLSLTICFRWLRMDRKRHYLRGLNAPPKVLRNSGGWTQLRWFNTYCSGEAYLESRTMLLSSLRQSGHLQFYFEAGKNIKFIMVRIVGIVCSIQSLCGFKLCVAQTKFPNQTKN